MRDFLPLDETRTHLIEEFLRGRCLDVLNELRKRSKVRGEITLLIGRPEEELPLAPLTPLRQRVDELMRKKNLSRMQALKIAAKERGISKRQAYREYEQSR